MNVEELKLKQSFAFHFTEVNFYRVFPTLSLQLKKSTQKIPMTSFYFFSSLLIILLAKCSPAFSLKPNIQCTI